jgi:hypothetical protein
MNPTRTRLLEMVSILCDRFPDWRFGQLVSNVAGWADVDVWDVEDEQLLDAIRAYLKPPRLDAESSAPEPLTVP